MANSESQIIVQNISRVLTARKKLIAAVAATIILLVIYYNESTLPTYEASTLLAFDQVVQPLTPNDTQAAKEMSLQSRLEEIKSRSFAFEIVGHLDRVHRLLFHWPQHPVVTDSLAFLSAAVQEQISAMPVGSSNFIRISVLTNHPMLSQEIANQAVQVLQDRTYRIRQQGATGVKEFIEQQLDIYARKLHQAEEELRIYKEQVNITSIDQESQELMRKATDVEVMYNSIKARRGSTEEQLASIRKIIANQKQDLIPNVMDIGSPWAQKIKEKLVALQGQFMELSIQKYAPDHPKMVQLAQEIKQTRENLRAEANKLVSGKNLLDPITQMEKYISESINLEIELESLKAQQAVLQSTVENYNAALSTLPDKESRLVRLLREREVNQKLYIMLLEKHESAKIAAAERFADVRVIDQAFLPLEPVNRNKLLNIGLGLLTGLIFGVGLAFFVELKKGYIASTDELEKITGYPVLTSIPRFSNTGHKSHAAYSSEEFRILRTVLFFRGLGSKYKTVLITSSVPSEGKSITSANLAIALASAGQRVILIDTDLRIPKLHTLFKTENKNGIGEALEKIRMMSGNPAPSLATTLQSEGGQTPHASADVNPADLAVEVAVENPTKPDALHLRTFIRPTKVKRLSLIVSGKTSINPSELFTGSAVEILLARLKKEFDVVLIDSAPMQPVSDAMILSALVDGVLLLVDPDMVDEETLRRTKSHLQNARTDVIGIIRNRVDRPKQYSKYTNYYKN